MMLSIPNLKQSVNLKWAVIIACVTASLVWIDSAIPDAGLWLLVILTATLGFIHGALDVRLMQQRFSGSFAPIIAGLGYLATVLLLAWLLSNHVDIALWLLLLMSAWHFGEPYGRWDLLPFNAQVLTRYVVGGAPIMLPLLIFSINLELLLQSVLSAQTLALWFCVANFWLILLLFWALFYGLRSFYATRYPWTELFGVLILNILFSPVMAFAVYFGMYHAPVHIWRVRRSQPAQAKMNRLSVAIIFVMTLMLSIILWQWLGQKFLASTEASHAVRWLIVVLTALTLPHLVLVSLSSRSLSGVTLNESS
jgi:Brp/Blh family beta-carotene 15,15'-monooxygenase